MRFGLGAGAKAAFRAWLAGCLPRLFAVCGVVVVVVFSAAGCSRPALGMVGMTACGAAVVVVGGVAGCSRVAVGVVGMTAVMFVVRSSGSSNWTS